ncbi:hypothetical protein [Clostridium sp.]
MKTKEMLEKELHELIELQESYYKLNKPTENLEVMIQKKKKEIENFKNL